MTSEYGPPSQLWRHDRNSEPVGSYLIPILATLMSVWVEQGEFVKQKKNGFDHENKMLPSGSRRKSIMVTIIDLLNNLIVHKSLLSVRSKV